MIPLYGGLSGAKSCTFRSRQELSNDYLLAKIGVDAMGFIFTESSRPAASEASASV
jgi:hypothetical protein